MNIFKYKKQSKLPFIEKQFTGIILKKTTFPEGKVACIGLMKLFAHSIQTLNVGNRAIVIDFIDVVRTNIISVFGICVTSSLNFYATVCNSCNYILFNSIVDINGRKLGM